MKHLKRFNEELKASTYTKAATMLKRIGHKKRAEELDKYSISVSEKESLEKWENNIKKYSKYGTLKIKFENGYTDEFYFIIDFLKEPTIDTINHNKNNMRDYSFKLPIIFMVELVPTSKESINRLRANDIINRHNFHGGCISVMDISIIYDVNGQKIEKFSFWQEFIGDIPFEFEIMDRRSALNLKRGFMSCFNENVDYPIYDDNKVELMYDLLNITLCQRLDLTMDYNFSLERVYDDLNTYSINNLYKD